MKKIVAFLFAILISLSLVLSVCAEEQTEQTEETTLDIVSDWIEKVTSSTSIATLVTTILGFGGTGALVSAGLKKILALVKAKADTSVIVAELESSSKAIKEQFTSELSEMREKLKEEDERNKMLSSVLGIAFSYSKDIPASARAQIVSLLNGTEKVCDTVQETVSVAKEAIEEAESTAEKVETPALDEIVKITMG